MVDFIPKGFHTVTPYLCVEGVNQLIEFLKAAFDATAVKACNTAPDGTILHAEFKIGDSYLMLGEAKGAYRPAPANMYLYVPNTDKVYKQALAAGATSVIEPADQFYGDRNAGVKDASGNIWWIATHIEDVSDEEMERRGKAHAAEKEKAHAKV